jgi:hypothetical protein
MRATILWFDHRDGYGVATNAAGYEFYIDSSVIDLPELAHGGVEIEGVQHMLSSVNCLRKVRISLESAYRRQLRVVTSLMHYPNKEVLLPNAQLIAEMELERIEKLIAGEAA